MINPVLLLILAVLCSYSFIALVSPAAARTADSLAKASISQSYSPVAFSHEYDLKIASFINLSGTLTRTLTPLDVKQNRWQFTIVAEAALGLNSRLTSDFVFDQYQQIHTIQFKEKKPRFRSSDEKITTLTLSDQPLLDKANIQIQLQQDLIQGLDIQQISYRVESKSKDGREEPRADSSKIYRFRIVGKEKITTPAGEFMTLRIEALLPDNPHGKNQKLFWFAPEKNYLLVRYYQKDQDNIYSVSLVK